MRIYNIINIPKGLSPENECDCQGEYNSGYTAGYQEGVEDQKSKLSFIVITGNGEYTREDGFSAVSVNVSSSGAGYDSGYTDGFADGYDSGRTDGWQPGYNSGYTDGLNACSGGTGNEDLIANLQGDYFLIPEGTTKLRDGAFSLGNPRKDNAYPTQAFVIPDSVTEIGDGAFYNNTIFSSLTIPDTVESIGSHTFFGMSSLREIHLPSGITTIPTYAFDFAFSSSAETLPPVQPVVIPASVTEIGSYAFDNCYELKEIIFEGSGITAIPEIAFGGCYTLTGFTMPEGVTSIGRGAFSGCRSLSAITIPSGVTEIGNIAFQGCRTLTGISLPDGITTISAQTFDGCSAMTTVKLPSGLTSIQNAGFSNCVALTSITIPAGVTQLGTNAFAGCSALTEMVFEGTTPPNGNYNTSMAPIGSSAYTFPFIVPCESVDAYKTKFGTRYRDRVTCNSGSPTPSATAITLDAPSTVTVSADTTVTITPSDAAVNLQYSSSDNTVATVDGNGKITVVSDGTVTITVEDLDTGLQDSVTITAVLTPVPPVPSGDTVQIVYNVSSTTRPTRILEGGGRARLDFDYFTYDGNQYPVNSATTAFTFSTTGKQTVEYHVIDGELGLDFSSVPTVIEANLPSGITSTDLTFASTSLTAITIQEGLQVIGEQTFENTPLSSVTLPDSCEEVGGYAFHNCSALTGVSLGSARWYGTGAFKGCSSLTGITFPEECCSAETAAEGGLFYEYVLSGCTSLQHITFLGLTPPTLLYGLGTEVNCPIYVPAESVELYKTTWPAYASRIQAITD